MVPARSSVGRRVASRLGLPFFDADNEIEAAAGCSISDLFAAMRARLPRRRTPRHAPPAAGPRSVIATAAAPSSIPRPAP